MPQGTQYIKCIWNYWALSGAGVGTASVVASRKEVLGGCSSDAFGKYIGSKTASGLNCHPLSAFFE